MLDIYHPIVYNIYPIISGGQSLGNFPPNLHVVPCLQHQCWYGCCEAASMRSHFIPTWLHLIAMAWRINCSWLSWKFPRTSSARKTSSHQSSRQMQAGRQVWGWTTNERTNLQKRWLVGRDVKSVLI